MARGIALKMTMLMLSCSALGSTPTSEDDFRRLRLRMVADQIEARGVQSPEVLQAMRKVLRHEFVPPESRHLAYADHPLSIGYDQTISQPYIVAYMTEALAAKKGDKVLEVGTGSGYQAAVLAQMGVKVYTVEIVEELALRAKKVLAQLGHTVHLRVGDGYDGWPEAAPFDGIIVTAAPTQVPGPLVDQLKEGGQMVIPVGRFLQDLKVYRKVEGKLVVKDTLPVRFVPMTGKATR